MDVKVTKSTKITLSPQEVQEAIADYLEKKVPNTSDVVKGDIKFMVDVHEQGENKLKSVELIIVETQKG